MGCSRLPEKGFSIWDSWETSGRLRETLPRITPDQTRRMVRPTASKAERTRKIFLPSTLADDPVRRERFFAEVRIARQVSHPNICRVYDIGETGTGPHVHELGDAREFFDLLQAAVCVTQDGSACFSMFSQPEHPRAP